MLKPIFFLYWEVCLLRRSPADTPYSWVLFATFSFLYYLLLQFQWYFQALPVEYKISNPMVSGVLLVFANFVFLWGLLKASGKDHRFVQTTTTLMAVHSIMHALLMPLILWMSSLLVLPGEVGAQIYKPSTLSLGVMVFIGVVSLVVTIWQIVVIIYIMRKAMDSDQLSGVLAMFGLLLFSNVFASVVGAYL